MTHDQLEKYINGFQHHQREAIYKQIIDSELLAKAFETSEGKQVLNSAVDLIASNVIKIVSLCNDNEGDEFWSKIEHSSTEINVTYKLMTDWAKILIRGSEHKEKAEKIK